jgi:SAM-dependent methyltransferase
MDRDTNPDPPENQDLNGAWQESDSATFLDFGRIFTPARHEIERVFLDLVPARKDESFLFVDIGTGQGWLSERILRHFEAARGIGLDGSHAMLEQAGALLAPFSERVELRHFRLEDPAWPIGLGDDVRCFVSSLVIHHLDDHQKRELYARLYQRLEPGGALLIADVVAPTSEWERRHIARAWDDEVKRQSLDLAGDLRAYEFFVQNHWNIYDYPDPMDKPSRLPDQLRWMEEAGFTGVDVFWAKAGHAVFGGYKGGEEKTQE